MRTITKSRAAQDAVSPPHDPKKLEQAKERFQARKQRREEQQ